MNWKYSTCKPGVSNRTKSNKIERNWTPIVRLRSAIKHNRTCNFFKPNPVRFCSDCISWWLSLIANCSIIEHSIVFDCQTFDCVRLTKFFGEFNYVRLPNTIKRLAFDFVRLPNVWLDTPGCKVAKRQYTTHHLRLLVTTIILYCVMTVICTPVSLQRTMYYRKPFISGIN